MNAVELDARPVSASPRREFLRRTAEEVESMTAEELRVRGVIPAGRRQILVPLDGTPAAEHALPYAIAMAQQSGAILQIAQIYSYFDDFRERGLSWSDENPVGTVQGPRKRYLATIVRRIARHWNIPIVANLIQDERSEEALRNLHAEAGLTVMTSRRRTWLGRFCRRSMVDSLLTSAERPLLLVKGYDFPVDLTGSPVCQHVLAVIETSDDLPETVDEFWVGPRPRDAQLTILPLNEDAAGPLAGWAATQREEGCGVRIETLSPMAPHQVYDLVEERDVDLMAVPHLGHLRAFPWEDHTALRSIAAGAPVPVLVRGSLPSPVAAVERFVVDPIRPGLSGGLDQS